MSASKLSAARNIWRARRERTGRDTAYVLYVFLLIAVIIIVPIARALWVVASSQAGLAALASADTSAVASMIVATLWAGALLVGRKRGPALLPPFLVHALTSGSISRARALRQPLLRSVAVLIFANVVGAVLVGRSLFIDGQTQLGNVIVFSAAALCVGVVTAMLWLIGQVYPNAAFPFALILLALAWVSVSMPKTLAFAPGEWVAGIDPLAGSGVFLLLGAAVLIAASITMTPMLLNRLTGMQLSTQAAQWEQATAFSFSFDFRAATAVYESEPRLGRHLRATRPSKHRWVTFFLRDAVALARTPGRSFGAVAATAAAGALMTLSFLPGTPTALFAGAAGIVTYCASGPVTKGLQHAASVAGDYPLYGISDRHLVLLHVFFPLTALLTVLTISATVTAFANGASLAVALTGVGSVGVLAFGLRLSSALKGPLPPSMLTPVNTPAGDLSVFVQICWAFSEPLIAIVGALTVTMLPITPIPFMMLAAWVGVLILVRWKKRR